MFNDVITSGQKFAARVLRTFVDGPKTAAEVSEALKIVKCGDVSDALRMLCEAGFLAEEGKRNPETGETLRERRYRLRDNYTRFYLKFIEPHKDVIDAGAFEFSRLDEIEGIDAVMGLAFEKSGREQLSRVVAASPYGWSIGRVGRMFFSSADSYEGLETLISIMPTVSDYSHLAFDWPSALSELEDGMLVTLKFTLHGGVEGSTEQVLTRIVVAKMA